MTTEELATLVAQHTGRARSKTLNGVPPSRARDGILHELDYLAALAGPHLASVQACAEATTDHDYTPPGQVSADRPAPDQCVVCGAGRAGHRIAA